MLLLADTAASLPSWLLTECDCLPLASAGQGDLPATVLLDVSDRLAAERAIRALADTRWIALLPSGQGTDASRWWQLGAFDAVDRADAPALRRAVERARMTPDRVRAMIERVHAMQASLDNIPTPIFAKDAEGIYRGCNQAFVDYVGLAREQIIGKTVYDVAPPALATVYGQADRQLLASGGRQVYEAQVKWADGSLRDVIFHKAVFHDAQGQVAGQAGAIFDITDRKRLEHGLRELAQTDPLTGLLNRRCFIERATAALVQARATNTPVAVLVFDIDHFKQINDSHGHAAGDAILCHLARLGRSQLRDDDLIARIGGDEFAILLGGTGDARAVAARLPARVAGTPLQFEGNALTCAISLGAAVVVADHHDVDSALRQADAALYEAKRQGRARAVVFDSAA